MKSAPRLTNQDAITASFIERYLHDGLNRLDEKERVALFLRFWKTQTIAEIAGYLKIDWESANNLIERSLERLSEQESLREAHSLLRFYQLGTLEENV